MFKAKANAMMRWALGRRSSACARLSRAGSLRPLSLYPLCLLCLLPLSLCLGGRADSGAQASAGVYSALTRRALGLSRGDVNALIKHCQTDKNKTNI